jgi:hypothetical protein
MTLLAHRHRQAPTDTEALIKEARRLRRRRWLIAITAAAAAALLAAAITLDVTSGSRPVFRGPTRIGSNGPVVDSAALRGQGNLAFVSESSPYATPASSLYVIDGSNGAVRRVDAPGFPSQPKFSADGKYLAFIESGPSDAKNGLSDSLWIANGDGSDAFEVHGLGDIGHDFSWAPRSDLLAVAAGPQSTSAPYGQPTQLRLVSPDGSSRVLVHAHAIGGAVWSPNGDALAVMTAGNLSSTLTAYPLNGARATRWLHLGGWIVPLGWWPKWGIGYSDPQCDCGDAIVDGSSFSTIASPEAKPVTLGNTLTTDSDGLPTANADGNLAYVEGGDRSVWGGERLRICTAPSDDCISAPAPRGAVSVDPAWSADGSLLAFAEAPGSNNEAYFPATVEHWYNAHELWLFSPATGSFREVATASGATVPMWSAGGHSLLYESHDDLYLLRGFGAKPIEVAAPLFEPTSWFESPYYGTLDWVDQFAWSGAASPGPVNISSY